MEYGYGFRRYAISRYCIPLRAACITSARHTLYLPPRAAVPCVAGSRLSTLLPRRAGRSLALMANNVLAHHHLLV